jgi:hypothetical protein
MADTRAELAAFLSGEADPARFPHREHVRMAYETLRRHDFARGAFLYSRALRSMAAKAGKPDVFHQTITIAFLSAIAERMGASGAFDDFAAANPDLIDKSLLLRWYRPERLASLTARRTFLLPDPAP